MSDAQKTLLVYRTQNISLRDALSQWLNALGNDRAIALAYGRDSCLVTIVGRGGDLEHPTHTPNPYEVRAFTDCSELRWLRIPSEKDTGKAAVLSDKSFDMPPSWQQEEVAIAGTLCQQYLVWGEGTGRTVAPGWSEVGEARIGGLALPLSDLRPHRRAVLRTVEYLAVDERHGNTFVYDERLTSLEPSDVEQP